MIAAARARGIAVIGELELAWRLLAQRVRRRHRDQRQDDDGRADRRDPPRGGLRGRRRRQRRPRAEPARDAPPHGDGPLDPATTIVCEASSFQLEDAVAFAPEAAVLLNLAPDHLDRHGDMDAYVAAKLRAVRAPGRRRRRGRCRPTAPARRCPGAARG